MSKEIDHLEVLLESPENINQHFEETSRFIKKHLKTSNVLIHSLDDASFSSIIVLAFLLHRKLSLQKALKFLKKKNSNTAFRPGINN